MASYATATSTCGEPDAAAGEAKGTQVSWRAVSDGVCASDVTPSSFHCLRAPGAEKDAVRSRWNRLVRLPPASGAPCTQYPPSPTGASQVPGENLTRSEAQERRAIVATHSYDVTLDLTRGAEVFG